MMNGVSGSGLNVGANAPTTLLLQSSPTGSRSISLPFPRSHFYSYCTSYRSAASRLLDSSIEEDSGESTPRFDSDSEINQQVAENIRDYKDCKAFFVPQSMHIREKENEESFQILLWALPTLLRYLPLDQIILALGCVIAEMKIIVRHKDVNVVSSVIFALLHLLKPLKWCSPVIILLPDSLMDFIESPVPIIIGLQQLPEGFIIQVC